MNLNTIIGFVGGSGRNQILSQTLAATTETEFMLGTDSGSTSTIAVLQIPQQTDIIGSGNPLGGEVNAAILGNRGLYDGRSAVAGRPLFTSTSFDKGKPFLVRLAGVVTPASNAANTLQFKLYSGTSKSGTAICATGALTGTQTSTQAGAFILESECIWDSVGQILYGQFWYAVAAGATKSYTTWAVNTGATVTAIANMKFVASAQWGNAAGGVVAVSEFSISQL